MGSGVVSGRSAMAALGPMWARAGGRRFSLLHRSLPCPSRLLPNSLDVPGCSHILPAAPWALQQVRGRARGNEYQPNNWKRKKTHGWCKRISTPGGIAVILRRMLKGRKSLTH